MLILKRSFGTMLGAALLMSISPTLGFTQTKKKCKPFVVAGYYSAIEGRCTPENEPYFGIIFEVYEPTIELKIISSEFPEEKVKIDESLLKILKADYRTLQPCDLQLKATVTALRRAQQEPDVELRAKIISDAKDAIVVCLSQ